MLGINSPKLPALVVASNLMEDDKGTSGNISVNLKYRGHRRAHEDEET